VLAAGVTVLGAALLLGGDHPAGTRRGRAAGLRTTARPDPTAGTSPAAAPSEPPAPGSPLWRTRLSGIRSRPAYDATRLYVNCSNGFCYALHASDGSTVWSRQVATTTVLNEIGGPAVQRNLVYVGSHDHHLWALSTADGAVVARAPSEQIVTTTPLVDDGTVYLPQAAMEAYDPASLARKWLFDQPSSAGDAVLTGDLVVFSTNSALVHAVNRGDGRQRWRYQPQGQTRPLSEHVAADDGAVFVTGTNGDCYAIELGGGGLRWRRPVGSAGAPPAAAGGLVFTATASDVYASGTRDGATRWKVTVPGNANGPLAVAAGLVFVCTSTTIVALRVASGAVAWQYPLGGANGVRYAEGVAYAGTDGGDLVAIASPQP
jgi:outer membrane protein assembly factor BamB